MNYNLIIEDSIIICVYKSDLIHFIVMILFIFVFLLSLNILQLFNLQVQELP